MRVVVAPDSFKGSATAREVAHAIAEGWRSERPQDEVLELPLADGGEGTAEVVLAATAGARRVPVTVRGPDDRAVATGWVLLPDGTAVVELAEASGLGLLAAPDPLGAHTIGFGELIAAALDAGAHALVLAIGGSGSTDGGSGLLTALGARLSGEPGGNGRTIRPGGGTLQDIVSVDLSGLRPLPPGGARVLLDVTAPLTGPNGAAAVFGPQKGATPADVERLDAGLSHWAAMLGAARTDDSPAHTSRIPGAGAAGGAGFGLLVWGATPTSGAEHVIDLVGLDALIRSADLVVTGEGRWDTQSAMGKLPSVVAAHAAAHDVPVALVAGAISAPTPGFADAVALTGLTDATTAMADPALWLATAGRELVRRGRTGPPRRDVTTTM